jgi:hypothetical protein
MSKEPVDYLKHIRDEGSYIMSVVAKWHYLERL